MQNGEKNKDRKMSNNTEKKTRYLFYFRLQYFHKLKKVFHDFITVTPNKIMERENLFAKAI